MSIAEILNQDMKAALRGGAKLELGALRLALDAIKKQEIEQRASLDDDAIIGVLGKLIKQGRDAKAQFEAGGRAELAAKEAAEIAVFERYMPRALTEDEIEGLINRAIQAAGATSIREMGQVMAMVKAEAAGRADLGVISARVREMLASD
jgi:uncharacterized protein YqeY